MRFASVRLLAFSPLAFFALATPIPAQEVRSDTLFTVEKYLDMEQVGDPQISPDGAQIIYTRQHVDRLTDRWQPELWIMAADGSRNRFLVRGSQARWSPDGGGRASYIWRRHRVATRHRGLNCSCAGWTPKARRRRSRT